ncbi:hypothetical protein [Atlantibacter hermannii]|uniref:hypothetical protein n=1 Tax=Atlantibacter hermannii TaxID=565 RepID=UPI00289D11B5|nr:hypothetical protein [Atlantibacter hermannii]
MKVHVVLSDDGQRIVGWLASPQLNSIETDTYDPRYLQFYESLPEDFRDSIPQPTPAPDPEPEPEEGQ